MTFKEIAFDVDGTLYSSEGIILTAYEQGINSFNSKYPNYNIKIPSLNNLLNLIGYPIDYIYENLFPKLSPDERTNLRKLIENKLLNAIKNKNGILFNGVYETLEYLNNKKYKLFIASNGGFPYLNLILKTYKIKKFFQPIITINNINICNKGDILLEYQKTANLNPNSTLMVGDRLSDLEAANKLGCRFIGCSYGHGNNNEIKSADIIISRISDIIYNI